MMKVLERMFKDVNRQYMKIEVETGQSEKPVAILAPVFSTMHTIWTV